MKRLSAGRRTAAAAIVALLAVVALAGCEGVDQLIDRYCAEPRLVSPICDATDVERWRAREAGTIPVPVK